MLLFFYHKVTNGTCPQPPLAKGDDVYYFGETFDAFECDNGMELINASTIQCIIGSSMDTFIWNDTRIPECKGKCDMIMQN